MPFRRNAVISVDFARRRQDLSEPSASDWAGAEDRNSHDLVDSALSLIEDACSVAGMLHPPRLHGREDVYPQRFESRKTGRAGYSPACRNEWVRGICEKPRIKCSECPHQRFLPVTDEVIRWHLCGQDDKGRELVMGVYPMLRDETCFFLAADFDKATWQQDAGAFLETCRQVSVPAALERSRSGNGGHVWFFFMGSTSMIWLGRNSINAPLSATLATSVSLQLVASMNGCPI